MPFCFTHFGKVLAMTCIYEHYSETDNVSFDFNNFFFVCYLFMFISECNNKYLKIRHIAYLSTICIDVTNAGLFWPAFISFFEQFLAFFNGIIILNLPSDGLGFYSIHFLR